MCINRARYIGKSAYGPCMSAQTFGDMLREVRSSAEMTQAHLGRIVHRAGATVSRWEQGHVRPARATVETLDRQLKCGGRLVRSWQVDETGSVLPHWMRSFAGLGAAAHTVEAFSPGVVVGPVQSEAYIRMVLEEGLYPGTPQEIDRAVAARLEQFEQLWGSNSWMVAVFPAAALTCLPLKVRSDQVERLLSLIQDGRVRIHLIPENTPTTLVAPLFLFHLREGGTVAGGEHVRGVVIYDSPSDIERLSAQAKRVLGSALPTGASLDFLKGLL